MDLTLAHWLYGIFTIVIIVTMIFRKGVVLPTILGTFTGGQVVRLLEDGAKTTVPKSCGACDELKRTISRVYVEYYEDAVSKGVQKVEIPRSHTANEPARREQKETCPLDGHRRAAREHAAADMGIRSKTEGHSYSRGDCRASSRCV